MRESEKQSQDVIEFGQVWKAWLFLQKVSFTRLFPFSFLLCLTSIGGLLFYASEFNQVLSDFFSDSSLSFDGVFARFASLDSFLSLFLLSIYVAFTAWVLRLYGIYAILMKKNVVDAFAGQNVTAKPGFIQLLFFAVGQASVFIIGVFLLMIMPLLSILFIFWPLSVPLFFDNKFSFRQTFKEWITMRYPKRIGHTTWTVVFGYLVSVMFVYLGFRVLSMLFGVLSSLVESLPLSSLEVSSVVFTQYSYIELGLSLFFGSIAATYVVHGLVGVLAAFWGIVSNESAETSRSGE